MSRRNEANEKPGSRSIRYGAGRPMKERPVRSVRSAALITMICGALLQACASSGPSSVGLQSVPQPSLGDYLSARFAGSMRDTTVAADYYLKAVQRDPDNPRLLQRAFALTVQDARFDQAVVLAHRLASLSSSATIAQLILVLDDIARADYEAARTKLDGAPTAGINALFGPVMRAWALVGDNRIDEALDALAPLSEEQSFHAFMAYHRAMILEVAGRNQEAEASYNKALSGRQRSIRVVLAYGRLLERSGRAEDSLFLYQEHLDRFPVNPLLLHAVDRATRGEKPGHMVSDPAEGVAEALFGTAHALISESARPAATVYLRLATFLRPDMPDAYLLLGSVLQGIGQLENALREYGRIPDHSPLAWGVKLEMASIISRLDRPEEAITLLSNMVGERANDLQAITALADVLRDQERYEEAGVQYDRAIATLAEVNKNHWPLFYSRGIALERTKQWERAEADFLKALELELDQPLVLNYLGYSWIEMGRNVERARAMIERAVELRPNDGYIVDSLGWAMFRLGDYESAVDTLERAILLQPDDPTINDHLGDAYWKVGRLREARFQWRHALALGPAADLVPGIEAKLEGGAVTAENERP
ncbi:MAG: tetratricopeptide repeat protein [Sphingomonadales bacterium]